MSEEVVIGMNQPDTPDKQKITIGKRVEMEVSGAHSEVDQEEENGREKVEVKEGGEDPFGRELGADFVQDKREEANLLGLAVWRKKMLRRMG